MQSNAEDGVANAVEEPLDPPTAPEQEEAEAEMIKAAAEVFANDSAEGNIPEEEFTDIDLSGLRMAEKPVEEEVDEEQDDEAPTDEGIWGSKPSVSNQAVRYPESVRMGELTSYVLDLSKPKDLETYNEFQREASDLTAPSLTITQNDRQFYEGKWCVFLTTAVIQYQQI